MPFARRSAAAPLLVFTLLLASVPAARTGILGAPAGAVVLAFDDGCANQHAAAAMLDARGFRGTFFVLGAEPAPETRPECHDLMNRAQVRDLASRGHDIESHTATHADLTRLDAAAAQRELVQSQSALRNLTGQPTLHLAYPYGASSDAVAAETAEVYQSARLYYRDIRAMPLDVDAGGRYAVPAIGVENATTIDEARSYVDLATSRGTTIILVFHDVTTSPGEFDVTPGKFAAILDHIAAKGVPVRTYAEALAPPEVHFGHQGGDEWRVQVAVSGSAAASVLRVESRDTDGPWVALAKQPGGEHAGSFRVEPGHLVSFRATLSDGRVVESCPFAHPQSTCAAGAQTLSPEGSGGFGATFQNARGNMDGGIWTTFSKRS